MRDVLRAVFLYFLCLGWQDLRANCTKLKLLGKKKKPSFPFFLLWLLKTASDAEARNVTPLRLLSNYYYAKSKTSQRR